MSPFCGTYGGCWKPRLERGLGLSAVSADQHQRLPEEQRQLDPQPDLNAQSDLEIEGLSPPSLQGQAAPGFRVWIFHVNFTLWLPGLLLPPFLTLREEMLPSKYPAPKGRRPCSFRAYPQGSWESDWGQGKAYSGSRYPWIMGCLLPLPQLSPKAASGLLVYL